MSLADITTEEVALFQLIEQGFVGINNGVTIIRATDAGHAEAQRLYDWVCLVIDGCEEGTDPELYQLMKEYLEKQLSRKAVAVLTVFKPGIEEGSYSVEPVARLLTDPSEVIDPQFEHTDGEGNAKEDEPADNNTPDSEGDPSNGADNGPLHS